MPRKPRIEYAGAIYHVLSRGNRGRSIFRSESDCRLFLDTLTEACQRCGWIVHAYVLMGNHYHLLLETPEANLVAGMRWLQGTFTIRHNKKYREYGHLLQGRYKAIPVEDRSYYFTTVAQYIHLNPARKKSFDPDKSRLSSYFWSSYPAYLKPRIRPAWLNVKDVLESTGYKDTPVGRGHYHKEMEQWARELHADKTGKRYLKEWKPIRRGWYLGDEAFRDELIDLLGQSIKKVKRESLSGKEILYHDETVARRWIQAGMKKMNLTAKKLSAMKKSCPEKYALAWLVRKHTCVPNAWIKEQLKMGKATNFATYLQRLEQAKQGAWGYAEYKKVKNMTL